jgi:hypothetical protein
MNVALDKTKRGGLELADGIKKTLQFIKTFAGLP